MATTCGPELPTHAIALSGFDDACLGHVPGPDHGASLRTVPLANSSFAIPQAPTSTTPRAMMSSRPELATKPSLPGRNEAVGSRERRSSAIPLSESSSSNSGAGLKPGVDAYVLSSAPDIARATSPSSSRPSGAHRHRRGGSEFVGGSIRMGDSITVMSNILAQPSNGLLSHPGRPTHTRNRSASPSIGSCSSTLALQPLDANRQSHGKSAPVSPSDAAVCNTYLSANSALEIGVPTINISPESPTVANLAEDPSSTGVTDFLPSLMGRVGFSEAVEYIPRPVSMVSSDTSSSRTVTARPSHSLHGSVSSLVSTNLPVAAAALATDGTVFQQSTARSGSLERTESRPSSAGAILDRVSVSLDNQPARSFSKRRNSIPALIILSGTGDKPTTTTTTDASPSKTPKRWSFFGLEPFAVSPSPTRSRPTSSSSGHGAAVPDSTSSDKSPEPCLDGPPSDSAPAWTVAHDVVRPKKKKVKKWAGAILTRKAKPRAHKSCENLSTFLPPKMADSPSPLPPFTPSRAVVEPPMPVLTVTEPTTSPHEVAVSRPVSAPSPDDDVQFDMIDLDIAMTPLEGQMARNAEWDVVQKAVSQAKRPLHSAQGLKGFSGPGMHYHRRTESAPEMAPMEGLRRGLQRYSSRATMADVFEEEEEDDGRNDYSASEATASRANLFGTPRASIPDTLSSLGSEPDSDHDMTPPCPADADAAEHEPAAPPSVSKPAFVSHRVSAPPPSTSTLRKERSSPLLGRYRHKSELGAGIKFRTRDLFNEQPAESTLAPPKPVDVDVSPLHRPPVQLPSVVSASPWMANNSIASSSSSSQPSPRSPASYDAHTTSTMSSPASEETSFQSLLMGEPGPEVRISFDAPSLSSGVSAATGDSILLMQSGHVPPASTPNRPRPMSLVAPIGARRSSLASLSRLINSSHSERSKLSVEVSVDGDSSIGGDGVGSSISSSSHADKAKVSRSKRLSRLMQFWKPSKQGKHLME